MWWTICNLTGIMRALEFFSFHLYKQNHKLTSTHNIRRCYILFVFDYKIPICITECACRTVCIVQSFWYSVYLHIFIYIYVCVFLLFVCVEYLHIIWLQRNKFVCALVSDIMRVLIRTELIFAIFNALWFILNRLSSHFMDDQSLILRSLKQQHVLYNAIEIYFGFNVIESRLSNILQKMSSN